MIMDGRQRKDGKKGVDQKSETRHSTAFSHIGNICIAELLFICHICSKQVAVKKR